MGEEAEQHAEHDGAYAIVVCDLRDALGEQDALLLADADGFLQVLAATA